MHLNRYEESEPAQLRDRYALLREEMDRNQVDYAIVLSSYKVNERRPSTDEILEVVGQDPRIGVVAGVSYLSYRAADLAHLRALLREKRILGLKLYPGYEPFYVHDPRMRVIYELAAEFGIPVMVHTGDTFDPRGKVKYAHPIDVDEVAVDFPNVTFVICHLGNPWVTDAMEVIYKNDNVVGDISGFTLRDFEERFERFMLDQVREVIAYAGNPHSILYGTDWPISGMRGYLRFVDKLELGPEEKDWILWQNSARVFRLDLPVRQAAGGS
ncbi:MAG: amidohydrolase family protein [Gemmatimonadetes bacterium]|nr:amidohydrolase family protein [Gemmatimonadota bacterium]